MLGVAEAVVKRREAVEKGTREWSENPLRGLGDLAVRSEYQAKLARKRSARRHRLSESWDMASNEPETGALAC